MIRPAALLSLALLTGCTGSTAPPASAPGPAVGASTASAPAAVEGVHKAELSILGVTPGKTTLEEFKTRFKVTEVKETGVKGVQTAEVGKGAIPEGEGIRSDSVIAAFVDGVLFDVKLQTVDDHSALLEKMWDKPTRDASGAQTWVHGDLNVVHIPESRMLHIFDSAKGLQAFDRGYEVP